MERRSRGPDETRRSVSMNQCNILEAIRLITHSLLYVLLLCMLCAVGCQSESDGPIATNTVDERNTAPSQSLDFDALLTAVDDAIGNRFQAMQMDAMNSATYQYGGPIKAVVDIVDPIAKDSGFTLSDDQSTAGMGEAEKEMQAKMGINMSSVDQVMYTHPSGDTLMIVRMDMSNDDIDMKMLTVQLMNPKKMSEFGAKVQKP
ncbi:hypothetical protein [Rhodopirellula baltica]|nr:hypothetical protein [Rhodopirellula baltica]